MAVPVVRFPLIPSIRILGFVTALLVSAWAIGFRGGLALVSDDKDLIFNVNDLFLRFFLWFLLGSFLS